MGIIDDGITIYREGCQGCPVVGAVASDVGGDPKVVLSVPSPAPRLLSFNEMAAEHAAGSFRRTLPDDGLTVVRMPYGPFVIGVSNRRLLNLSVSLDGRSLFTTQLAHGCNFLYRQVQVFSSDGASEGAKETDCALGTHGRLVISCSIPCEPERRHTFVFQMCPPEVYAQALEEERRRRPR